MAAGKNIVPFGKYKGQDVTVMAADQAYCEWLRNQPWFAEKFRDVYNIVINYGSEPQDTPEHNALQARFLDESFCMAFARIVAPLWFDLEKAFELERWELERRKQAKLKCDDPILLKRVEFEKRGWDVYLEFSGGRHFSDGYYGWHYGPEERHSPLTIECKPLMGDDYPSVLRQIKGYRVFTEMTSRFVLVGSFSARGATLDQVRRIFATSGIRLVMLDEVLANMEGEK